jgi:hypothetical protein
MARGESQEVPPFPAPQRARTGLRLDHPGRRLDEPDPVVPVIVLHGVEVRWTVVVRVEEERDSRQGDLD